MMTQSDPNTPEETVLDAPASDAPATAAAEVEAPDAPTIAEVSPDQVSPDQEASTSDEDAISDAASDAASDATSAAGEADDAPAEDAAADPATPTEAEIARVRDLFRRTTAAEPQLEGFHFARWTRPLCPAVFGVDDAAKEAMAAGLRDAAALVGLELVDEDPDLGANVLYFFCSEWTELRQVPSLDRLIPDLEELTVLLTAADANQYRVFSFDQDVGLRLAVVLIRYDADLGKLSPQALALGQAVQALLLWSDQAFTRENPVDLGYRRGRSSRDRRPRVTRWFSALLKAAYAEDAPAYSADETLAEQFAAQVAAELDVQSSPRRSSSRGGSSKRGASEAAAAEAAEVDASTESETTVRDDEDLNAEAQASGGAEEQAVGETVSEAPVVEASAAEERAEAPTISDAPVEDAAPDQAPEAASDTAESDDADGSSETRKD